MIEANEKHKFNEEKSYEIMIMQEKIVDKWKTEHKLTVDHYEKVLRNIKTENKHLSEKYYLSFNNYRVIELKGMLRLEKENNDGNLYEKMKT